MSLEDHLGLHEKICIIYQVSGEHCLDDCYLAILLGGDGANRIATAEGATVEEALRCLAEKVE